VQILLVDKSIMMFYCRLIFAKDDNGITVRFVLLTAVARNRLVKFAHPNTTSYYIYNI
jgi:hypothetical protein